MAIELDDITSGYNLSKINTNFQKVEDYINDKVLHRANTGVAGEAKMERDLDMDGYAILNADIDASSLTNDRAIRVKDLNSIPAIPQTDVERRGKVVTFDINTGAPIAVAPASGSAVDVLNQLALPTGASLVGYGSGTVEDGLDSIKSPEGFAQVGKFLNISELRNKVPNALGDIVFVSSSKSSSSNETHYGGGFFQAVTKEGSDDDGINIQPATGTLMWRRIGYSTPEFVFWGVKPNSGIDNSAEILAAMTYVRSKKCTIKFPAGTVTSTEALPIWTECTIEGDGRAVSRFVKTTNNGWLVAPGVPIDALCVCLPDVYDPDGATMDTFCMRPRITGISLERQGITDANKPTYGIWGHKIASGHFSHLLVLGGHYGFYGINCFLMIQEQISYALTFGSYAGAFIARSVSGQVARAGTTCHFNQVSTSGPNFGFYLAGLDSTKLTQCDVEATKIIAGEPRAVAYNWINPMNCTMDNCYTEGVDGVQVAATNLAAVSIANSLVITGMNITPGEVFTSPTKLMDFQGGGFSLDVVFIGGDMRNAAIGAGNMLPPNAEGSNTRVKLLGATTNPWTTAGGATVTSL